MCVCGTNRLTFGVAPVDINLHQPAAISGNSKSNIVPLTSLIPLCSVQVGVTANRGSPTLPSRSPPLPDLYSGRHANRVAQAVQIYSDMPPTASVDIIKRRDVCSVKKKNLWANVPAR